MRALRIGFLLVLLGGCSAVFVRGPQRTGPPRCTTSGALPIGLDAAAAFVTLVTGFAGTYTGIRDEDAVAPRTIGIVSLALSAAYIASFTYGIVTVHRCNQAQPGGVSRRRARDPRGSASSSCRGPRASSAACCG